MSDISSYIEILIEFKSLGGAVGLGAFYAVSASKILHEVFRRPSYALTFLVLFCSIRIPSFAMRAIISERINRGEVPDFEFFIADQVLFGVGIIPLLYGAYTIAFDRELLAANANGLGKNSYSRFTSNRVVFWVVSTPAVVLGIVGPCLADLYKGYALHQASTVIFLVLTVLVASQIFLAVRAEFKFGYQYADKTLGGGLGAYVLSITAILFLLRGCYEVATMVDLIKQNYEPLWYPLFAVPETVALVLLAARNLVPPLYELPTQTSS